MVMQQERVVPRRSYYLDKDTAEELDQEAKRLERTPAWLLRRAWEVARPQFRKLQTVEKVLGPKES